MLTYNVDVLDSLSNGVLGEVVGLVKGTNQRICSILVKFDNPKVGKEKRKHNSAYLQAKYPNIDVTPIEKMEFRFNLSKNQTSQNDLMLATQFPLKLSFACTSHKIQGSTIVEPNKVIIDLESVKQAAEGYVMMSRPQCLHQVYILGKFQSSKIFSRVHATL